MTSQFFNRFICAAGTVTLLGGAAACGGPKPTNELLSARAAYKRAETSNARQYSPDYLLTARQQLEAAEAANQEDEGSNKEKTEAYIAERKARLAVAAGNIKAANAQVEQSKKAYTAELESENKRSRVALGKSEAELGKTEAELATERAARAQAEQRAQQALASLNEIAKVKEENRGMVITLQGAVIFKSGKSDLLPMAREQLGKVAEALKAQGLDKSIVIEGHTDSRGKEAFNLQLSQARAEAVRGFLVERGLDGSKLVAVGKGPAEPIANNSTAEGRANNRRVEIVVSNNGAAASTEKTEQIVR